MSTPSNRERMLLTLQVQQAEADLARTRHERAHTGHGVSLLRPFVFRIRTCACSRSRDAGMPGGAILRGFPARAAGSYRVRYKGKHEKRHYYRSRVFYVDFEFLRKCLHV